MKLSVVIVTYNRRDALLATLQHVRQAVPLSRDQWETWVVDNASTDGTAEAIAQSFPEVRVIGMRRNIGVAARNEAFPLARGEFTVLLDDDSYPVQDTVARSLDYLDMNTHVAAVVGRVLLPDGSFEACAMPRVLLSGAVCVRRAALQEIGGFRREFFRKAGEYDLSFRLWQVGYRIARFEDLLYRHDKVLTGRSDVLAHRMDVRNNLILVERFIPALHRRAYRDDWGQRYVQLARFRGHDRAARRGVQQSRLWAIRERLTGREVLDEGAFEVLFEHDHQTSVVDAWTSQTGARSVLIADNSKNIYATYRACVRNGLHVKAVVDNHPAFAGTSYRGIPIITDADAKSLGAEGVILSTVNPAVVERRSRELTLTFGFEPLTLWSPQLLGSSTMTESDALPLMQGDRKLSRLVLR